MRELFPNAEVTVERDPVFGELEIGACIILFLYKGLNIHKIVIPLSSRVFAFIMEFDEPISKQEYKEIDGALFEEMMMEYRCNMPEFKFEVDIPDEVIDYIGISQVKEILSKSETLSHVEV